MKHPDLCLHVFKVRFGLLKGSSQWCEILKIKCFEIFMSTSWEAVVCNPVKPDFQISAHQKAKWKRQPIHSFVRGISICWSFGSVIGTTLLQKHTRLYLLKLNTHLVYDLAFTLQHFKRMENVCLPKHIQEYS